MHAVVHPATPAGWVCGWVPQTGPYPHDIIQGEARMLCAQLGQQLLQELGTAQGQAGGGAGPEGPAQLPGEHLQGPHLLPLRHVLHHDNTRTSTRRVYVFVCIGVWQRQCTQHTLQDRRENNKKLFTTKIDLVT